MFIRLLLLPKMVLSGIAATFVVILGPHLLVLTLEEAVALLLLIIRRIFAVLLLLLRPEHLGIAVGLLKVNSTLNAINLLLVLSLIRVSLSLDDGVQFNAAAALGLVADQLAFHHHLDRSRLLWVQFPGCHFVVVFDMSTVKGVNTLYSVSLLTFNN